MNLLHKVLTKLNLLQIYMEKELIKESNHLGRITD